MGLAKFDWFCCWYSSATTLAASNLTSSKALMDCESSHCKQRKKYVNDNRQDKRDGQRVTVYRLFEMRSCQVCVFRVLQQYVAKLQMSSSLDSWRRFKTEHGLQALDAHLNPVRRPKVLC